MAIVYILPISMTAALITCWILKKFRYTKFPITVFLLLSIFSVGFASIVTKTNLHQVSSKIEIDAPIEKVWEKVLNFSTIEEPLDWIFKSGISYPTKVSTEGTGVGATRYCHFNTGPYVEKITIWNPPYHLVFDILEQPKPMNEISLYDIESSLLDHFFSSKTGELKLSELPNGNTLLEGSSWYQLNMEPSYYWHTTTDKIIQRIHMRAFKQIKYESEKEQNQ